MKKLWELIELEYMSHGREALIKALESLDRDELIRLCEWNDHNGIWRDEDCLAEFDKVFPSEDYRYYIFNWLTEENHVHEGLFKKT